MSRESAPRPERQDFFVICANLKTGPLKHWNPPIHPKDVLRATDEQKLNFADSLIQAVQGAIEVQASSDPELIKTAFDALSRLDPKGLLLKQHFASLRQLQASLNEAKQENRQRRHAEEKEKHKLAGEEYARFLDLMYADLIASTDLAKQFEQADIKNERQTKKKYQAVTDAVQARLNKYQRLNEILREHGEEDEARALVFFIGSLINRFFTDFPYKPQKKTSWLPWRNKREATNTAEQDTARYGEKLVTKAIDALYAQYKSHPEYASTGSSSQPIQEMAHSLMNQPQALQHLRPTLKIEALASEQQIARSIQNYLSQELKKRGLRS